MCWERLLLLLQTLSARSSTEVLPVILNIVFETMLKLNTRLDSVSPWECWSLEVGKGRNAR